MKPEQVMVRAIDLKPYHWALWCSIDGGEPFENEIVHRRWSADGARIWFMLDSHNFFDAAPDEKIEVSAFGSYPPELLARWDGMDTEAMARRPGVWA